MLFLYRQCEETLSLESPVLRSRNLRLWLFRSGRACGRRRRLSSATTDCPPWPLIAQRISQQGTTILHPAAIRSLTTGIIGIALHHLGARERRSRPEGEITGTGSVRSKVIHRSSARMALSSRIACSRSRGSRSRRIAKGG